MNGKKLTRSNDKMIAGVCGGIAEYLGWSPGGVRILYVLISIVSVGFPGIIVYLLLWMIMPKPPEDRRRFNVHHPGES